MTNEQKIADLLDGEWHDEKPHHAGLTWPLVDRMQLMKMPPINRIRLLKAPAKADEQNKPVRSRDEQIEDLASQIFFGARNHTDGMFEAKRHIEEAEARGAAEQRRKDGEGQEPMAYCAELATMRDMETGEYSGWKWRLQDRPFHVPADSIREYHALYPKPANVAALEARIAELESVLSDCVQVLSGNESNTGYCCCGTEESSHLGDMGHSYVDEGDYIRSNILGNARAALKREGGV